MNYLKNYIYTHFKFWRLYIVAIFSSLLGIYFVLIFVVRFLAAINTRAGINLVVSSFIAAVIGSLPILYTNYIIANNFNRGVVIKTIINHMITLIAFYMLMHFCLYWLIIDFR